MMREGLAFISTTLRYNTTTLLFAYFSLSNGCDSSVNATYGLFSWSVERLAFANRTLHQIMDLCRLHVFVLLGLAWRADAARAAKRPVTHHTRIT